MELSFGRNISLWRMNFHSKIECLIIEVLNRYVKEMSKNVEGLRDKIITQFSLRPRRVHIDSKELLSFV